MDALQSCCPRNFSRSHFSHLDQKLGAQPKGCSARSAMPRNYKQTLMYTEVPKDWGNVFTMLGRVAPPGIKFIVGRIFVGVSCSGLALFKWLARCIK